MLKSVEILDEYQKDTVMKTKISFWKRNGFMKRLNSFFTYQLAAYFSIYDPDGADIVMYRTLKRQFTEAGAPTTKQHTN